MVLFLENDNGCMAVKKDYFLNFSSGELLCWDQEAITLDFLQRIKYFFHDNMLYDHRTIYQQEKTAMPTLKRASYFEKRKLEEKGNHEIGKQVV